MHAKVALATAVVWPCLAAAQITADGTLGTRVTPSGTTFTIDMGTVKGNNLFHSFSAFSVPTGGAAYFDGPATTQNVISRVTGTSPSTIDGLISTREPTHPGASPMPSANFFFINPNGVTFTSSAALDVGGAFHASTANYIKLADGTVFSSAPAPGEVLTSAPPQSFGFLTSTPAPIVVDGAQLFVDPGQTLSLIGGDVSVRNGAAVAALGGVVQIVSVASPGEVVLGAPDLGTNSFAQLGHVDISNGAVVAGNTDGVLPGGTVVIRSGQLVVDNSQVLSDTLDVAGAPLGIDIVTRDSLTLQNGAMLQTSASGLGDGSGISITSPNLAVTGGAAIQSIALAGARSGNIDIHATRIDVLDSALRTSSQSGSPGNITLTASGALTVAGSSAEIASRAFNLLDPGIFAGNISISAADVTLSNRGKIQSGDATAQGGQSLAVTASDTLSISSLAGITSVAFRASGALNVSAGQLMMDAGYINSSTLGAGAGGRISVSANSVNLTNGAQIASSSEQSASGAGGSIAVNAGSVTLAGPGPANGVGAVISGAFTGNPNSGLFSTTAGSGNAGQISVMASTLTIGAGGEVSASTSGPGNAGTVSTQVGQLNMSGGALIDSSTKSTGAGGSISVQANGLSMSGTGTALSSTTSASGNAGQIMLSGGSVSVADGARVSVTTTAAGSAGTITTNVGTITVSGGELDSSTTSSGAGGAISVNAGSDVSVINGGRISADSTGAGRTGNVVITAGDRITMDGGSISTRAVTSDGGDITLKAPVFVRLENAQITTSVQSGVGSGGNVLIDPTFLVMNNSAITANAFGGPGGNITIIADNFLASSTALLQASSALSTPGTIQIVSPENNVAGSIAQLPRAFVDASRLLRGACSARREGAPSSFVLAGRGGVPPEADGYLPSAIAAAPPTALTLAHLDDCVR